jgi:small subunit ribosomal protein S18
VCQFCVDKIKEVDYKDLARLRRFLSERGKIEPRRKTGTCAAHQRSLNVALKRARQLALLPFTAEHIRVTGVLVREPGAPPFRGARPRPAELEGGAEGAAPEGAAEVPADGQTPAPSTEVPEAAAKAPEAEAGPKANESEAAARAPEAEAGPRANESEAAARAPEAEAGPRANESEAAARTPEPEAAAPQTALEPQAAAPQPTEA